MVQGYIIPNVLFTPRDCDCKSDITNKIDLVLGKFNAASTSADDKHQKSVAFVFANSQCALTLTDFHKMKLPYLEQ